MITDKISKLFNFISETNLIEEYFYEHKGQYPIFSGQTENNGIVAMIDTHNQEKDCVTMTTYGSAGKLYYRTGKYTIGRNCMGLIPKDEYKNKINLKWFSYKFQNLFYKLRIGVPQGQRSINQLLIENIKITIPDTEIQTRQLEVYEKANSLKNKILSILDELKSIKQSKLNKITPRYKDEIGNIFTLEGGNSGLVEKFIYHNQPYSQDDSLPVFSSATIESKFMGVVSEKARTENGALKIFSSPSILIARNGTFAGIMTYRNEKKFTTNDHAYVMKPKDEWKDKINLRWFMFQYQELFFNLITTKSGNATFSKEYAEKQIVKIPDIKFQDKIASKLESIDNITKELNVLDNQITDLMEHEII